MHFPRVKTHIYAWCTGQSYSFDFFSFLLCLRFSFARDAFVRSECSQFWFFSFFSDPKWRECQTISYYCTRFFNASSYTIRKKWRRREKKPTAFSFLFYSSWLLSIFKCLFFTLALFMGQIKNWDTVFPPTWFSIWWVDPTPFAWIYFFHLLWFCFWGFHSFISLLLDFLLLLKYKIWYCDPNELWKIIKRKTKSSCIAWVCNVHPPLTSLTLPTRE